MPDRLILAFDTAAAHCAAALLCGEQVLSVRFEAMEKGQAERLFGLLEAVLAEAGVGWRDLAGIGVGVGPGNFTGIRISVAAARGLAVSLGVPSVGVTAFEALAFGAGPVLAVVDARRGMHYLCVSAEAPVLAEDLPEAWRGSGLDVVGAQAARFAAATGGRALEPAFPVAVAVGLVAASRMATAQPRPVPLYLRSADAAPSSDPPPVILP